MTWYLDMPTAPNADRFSSAGKVALSVSSQEKMTGTAALAILKPCRCCGAGDAEQRCQCSQSRSSSGSRPCD
jgi:hypothetical protein